MNDSMLIVIKEIIATCYEYVDGSDCDVYFYCFLSDNVAYGNYFFDIGGQVLKKESIKVEVGVDTSVKRRVRFAKALSENINFLKGLKIFYEYRDPLEIKVHASDKKIVSVDLSESGFYEGSVSDRFENWFGEVRKGIVQ